MTKLPETGDVYVATLPTRTPPGHEQHGLRPIVIVRRPMPARLPMVVAIPLSSRVDAWQPLNPTTYLVLPAGMAGLTKDSVALLDHIQGIDERRLTAHLGQLGQDELRLILNGLRHLLGV